MNRIKLIFRFISNFFQTIVNLLIDSFIIITSSPKYNSPNKKAVLIIRLDAIGDFILWLDSANALKKLFPSEKYKLVLLGNTVWKDLAVQLNIFDEHIFVDSNKLDTSFSYRFNSWKQISNQKWDYAIQPAFSRKMNCGDSAVRVSCATNRIGSSGDLSNQRKLQKLISDRWFTQLLPADSKTMTELERNAEFVRNLGLSEYTAKLPTVSFPFLLPVGFTATNYFVVLPGAGASYRQWPVTCFAELIQLVVLRTGLIPVICGSLGEKGFANYLNELSSVKIEDWTGKTTLSQLFAIIRGCKFLIGNESAGIHIAATVGVQSFCIAGGGHWGRFLPYSVKLKPGQVAPVSIVNKMDCFCCNWKCEFPVRDGEPVRCIKHVTVDSVLKAMETSEVFYSNN